MLTSYILIQLNGKPFNCSHSFLLSDLLKYLNVDSQTTIIEYNGTILQEDYLHEITLVNGDKIELLTVVGGG